ncbi:hypothetical protein DW666_06995 [Streptococcus parasanguinis]|jgi:hypothetical protein|uniref:Uncharacterized protein n=1 Tax=Streptococcus parasanguinis TaxID=1318 RepID=A0A414PL30_STRPA|nr:MULTISPECIES: hypothetical protein [Streptococcus]MCP9035521.1 hypothetical protein [Streptococcus sp. CF8_Ac1-9]MCP9043459.1 hypothetical protein [Streptococcus sp. CF8_Ac1-11]RHC94936.1 hypothetical protein DW820_06250 [Streptococcus parasanguinis]RHF68760.1 hypothetical protein DW666_06995 [Streptococcus parasanguinis]
MSELKKRLSLLKVEKRINQLKGIKDVHFLTDKPKEIAWYAGELNPIDSPLPCFNEFPLAHTTQDLSSLIQSLVGNSSRFILVFWEFSPVYVLFQMESLDDFLPSYSTEFSTRDLTLFFQDQEKVLDLHLAEDKLEVRVLENKSKSP